MATFSDYIKLGRLCEDLNADAFISTYYTLAYNVANIGFAYDFIPERLNIIHSDPTWKIKYIYMKSLANILSISKSTSDEAQLFYPNLSSTDDNIFYPHVNNLKSGKSLKRREMDSGQSTALNFHILQ